MTKIRLLLFLILVLAFVLRLYQITQVPPSLNWDEASIGYNAYSILKTARDEWGSFLPVHFKSYGEYKLPGQIYFSIPAIAIFGLNPFAVRITPVIYGTITVLLLYLLTLELLKGNSRKQYIGLITAFFLAVSPWHIQLTRASFESSFALMWVILGAWFLLKGFNGTKKWWIVAVFPFVMATYTYNSARLFVPLFLIIVSLVFWKSIRKNIRHFLFSGIIFLVLLIPTFQFFFSGEGSARYKLVSISDDPGLIPRIEERRNNSNLPPIVTRLIHNRVTYISYYMGRNYLAHFSPSFLFVKGAFHKQHHPQGTGELYWIQAPFLLYGLYLLFKRKEKYRLLLIVWLLTAFVPVSLTNDIIPHALRTLNAVPVYQIITAYGIVFFYISLKKRNPSIHCIFLTATVFVFLFQFVRYQYYFYTQYPILYSRDWQYGNKEAVEYLKTHYSEYDLIVYTREYGEPHIFTLFYLQYPPQKYQSDPNLVRFETYDWVRVLRFDKFYFPDLGDEGTRVNDIVKLYPNQKILFIGTNEEIPPHMKKLKTIYFLNGNVAFQIVEKR